MATVSAPQFPPLEGGVSGCAVALALLAMLLVAAAGCLRQAGAAEPPPGEPNTYPQDYPHE